MKSPSTQFGFTLVEMIVSLALFAIVVTVSVGALLVLIASNEQLQAEQSVMTNLSFALDSMAREIRTGTEYFCDTRNNNNNNIFDDNVHLVYSSPGDQGLQPDDVSDCPNGRAPNNNHRYHGVAFNEGGESITTTGGRILYYYDAQVGKIFRRVNGGVAQSIVSSGMYITNAEFYVTGSKPLVDGAPDNQDQSTVTIFIEARATSTASKPYQIQTTITQRTLDI